MYCCLIHRLIHPRWIEEHIVLFNGKNRKENEDYKYLKHDMELKI